MPDKNKLVFPVVFIIIFLLILFFFIKSQKNEGNTGINNLNQQITVTSTPAETSDKENISELIENFYKKYEDCMKNPPKEAEGRVGEYCQGNSGLTTASFMDNLDKGGTAKAGADPIVCAQGLPEGFTVNQEIIIDGDRATGSVEEKFGPSNIKPQINLLKVSGVWKIDNVVCPKP